MGGEWGGERSDILVVSETIFSFKVGVNMKFGQTEQFFLLESSIASLFMIL